MLLHVNMVLENPPRPLAQSRTHRPPPPSLNVQKVLLHYSHYRCSVIVLRCFAQCATNLEALTVAVVLDGQVAQRPTNCGPESYSRSRNGAEEPFKSWIPDRRVRQITTMTQ